MSAVPEDIVQIEDLDHFVRLLTQWHVAKVKVLKHMLDVPDGTEAIMNEGASVVLSGDVLKGFRIGVTLGLTELGQLPFAAEIEDAKTSTKH